MVSECQVLYLYGALYRTEFHILHCDELISQIITDCYS